MGWESKILDSFHKEIHYSNKTKLPRTLFTSSIEIPALKRLKITFSKNRSSVTFHRTIWMPLESLMFGVFSPFSFHTHGTFRADGIFNHNPHLLFFFLIDYLYLFQNGVCYPRATPLANLSGTHASNSLPQSYKALKDIDSANVKN